jgi:hypothetical protein
LSTTIQGIKYPSSPIPIHILNILFVTKNKDQFISNSQVHTINTKQTSDLYIPTANLKKKKKGVYYQGTSPTVGGRSVGIVRSRTKATEFYYQGIKIYNHLSKDIKNLSSNTNKFKLALKRYLLDNSF